MVGVEVVGCGEAAFRLRVGFGEGFGWRCIGGGKKLATKDYYPNELTRELFACAKPGTP